MSEIERDPRVLLSSFLVRVFHSASLREDLRIERRSRERCSRKPDEWTSNDERGKAKAKAVLLSCKPVQDAKTAVVA